MNLFILGAVYGVFLTTVACAVAVASAQKRLTKTVMAVLLTTVLFVTVVVAAAVVNVQSKREATCDTEIQSEKVYRLAPSMGGRRATA